MAKIFMASMLTNTISDDVNEITKDIANPKILVISSSVLYNKELFKLSCTKFFNNMGIRGTVDVVDLYLNWCYNKDEDKIRNADIIYLPGGNTFEFYYSLIMRDVFCILKEKGNEDNTVFLGTSAGSIMMGNNICIAKFADYNSPRFDDDFISGLNFIPITMKPHWGSWETKIDLFDEYVKEHPKETLYCLYDGDTIFYDMNAKKSVLIDEFGNKFNISARLYKNLRVENLDYFGDLKKMFYI